MARRWSNKTAVASIPEATPVPPSPNNKNSLVSEHEWRQAMSTRGPWPEQLKAFLASPMMACTGYRV